MLRMLGQYSDSSKISSWAKKDVAMVLNDEIMEGITDSGFEPAGITTRAQAAVALKRLLSKFEEKAAVRINRPYLLILKRVRFFYITSTKFSNSSVHAKASCDTMIESVF